MHHQINTKIPQSHSRTSSTKIQIFSLHSLQAQQCQSDPKITIQARMPAFSFFFPLSELPTLFLNLSTPRK